METPNKGDSPVSYTHLDGRYLDVIGKVSRLKNDFTVRNSLGTSLSGDYRNTGTSLSVEYGKRIKKDNGFYIDPNAELTLSRLSGVNFDARTNKMCIRDSRVKDAAHDVAEDLKKAAEDVKDAVDGAISGVKNVLHKDDK